MKRLLTLAVLLISTAPVYAQGQQPNVAKLKAEARKVVSIIRGDKAKLRRIAKSTVSVVRSIWLLRREMSRRLTC